MFNSIHICSAVSLCNEIKYIDSFTSDSLAQCRRHFNERTSDGIERTTDGHRYAQINYCSIIRCDVEIWNLVPFLSCESYGFCQKFILMRLIFSLALGKNIWYFNFTFHRQRGRIGKEVSPKELGWLRSHRNSMRNTAEL